MRCRGLALSCAAGAIAACDIPRETFFAPDAGSTIPDGFGQKAYLKASNAGARDRFGQSVALSADGTTLALGAPGEASSSLNSPAGDDAPDAGAVYVFTRSGARWQQEAYLKAAHPARDDLFGTCVALSADGSVLAVGASSEDSRAMGVNGDETDDADPAAGAAYVFTRSAARWAQEAYIKPSNTDAYDGFGTSIALSRDGTVLAVGAIGEGSSDADHPADNSRGASGAVYVFRRATMWAEEMHLKAANPVGMEGFGASVALSGDGETLAVGLARDASFGKVFVFTRNGGGKWTRDLEQHSAGTADGFGGSVALSGDGTVLAVGASRDDSAGIDAGAVQVFTRTGMKWSKEAVFLTAEDGGPGDDFGDSVALSGDGTLLAVGASREASRATGVGGDPASRNAPDAGAVYLFARSDATWTRIAYIKASNTAAGDRFGAGIALSGDGDTLAVGAAEEDSGATQIDGDQSDDSEGDAGAVYVYH